MSTRRISWPSPTVFILGFVALAGGACAAAVDEDDGSSNVPPYQGGLTPIGSTPSGATAGAGGTSGSAEQQPGGIPIANGNAGASGVPASGGAATGGASSVPGGTSGAGNAPVGGTGGAANEPPPVVVDPFPVPNGPGCGAAAFFCEGFEDVAVGPAQQNAAWRPEGNASIDGVAVEGARALRLQPGGGQFARIALANFSAPNNSLFGRMFLRVEALPTSPNFAHWVIVEATGSGSSERVRALGGQFIDLQDRGIRANFWGIGADGGPTGDWTHWDNGDPVEAVSATWQCVEWRMSGADSAIDVWIDEQFQPSMSVSRDDNPRGTPFVFPTFNNMTIGWGVFQGGTTPAQFDVHIDDIVLSSERAGCN